MAWKSSSIFCKCTIYPTTTLHNHTISYKLCTTTRPTTAKTRFPIQSPLSMPGNMPSPPEFERSPPGSFPGTPPYGPSPPNNFRPSPPIYLPPVVFPPPSGPPPAHKKPQNRAWCVAKPTVPDPIIQEAMDYACGTGADCKSIQPDGSCYRPDGLLAHASYAFNSYWQNTKVGGGTCDFGGTAMLVTVDPSKSHHHTFMAQ
ncbi:hypothetical protein SLA2020_265670 [Shorea laevis]